MGPHLTDEQQNWVIGALISFDAVSSAVTSTAEGW